MFQTAGYPAHPPYFANYDYRSPPRSSPAAGGYNYYSPRQWAYTATPTKGHTRRATGDGATFTFTSNYSTPQKPTYYTPPDYSSPGYYASAQSTPSRKPDYVSGSDRKRESARYSQYRVFATDGGRKQRQYSSSSRKASRSQHVFDMPSDNESEYLPRYEQYETRPPPYKRHQSYYEPRTDRRYSYQVPIYTSAEPAEKPSRRASYTTKPTQPKSTPRRRDTATKPPPPKATEDDARRAGIPTGYSYKNWDPTEEPILLLGSAFDANSLGKWIYDWTVYSYGPGTPMTEVAGELWLLLIQIAGKVKRAEDCMPRIRQQASHEMVEDFLESGDRLWDRFSKLLKACESYMWKAARKESGATGKVTMGKNSGCEFVDSIFGRDRELEKTEKLMTGMRLWSMRFDANCEAILRNPSA